MIIGGLEVLGLLSYWDRVRDEYDLKNYSLMISFEHNDKDEIICSYEMYDYYPITEVLVDEIEFKIETDRFGKLDARVSGDFRDYGLTLDEAYDKIRNVLDKLEKDLDEETYNTVKEVDGGKRYVSGR